MRTRLPSVSAACAPKRKGVSTAVSTDRQQALSGKDVKISENKSILDFLESLVTQR